MNNGETEILPTTRPRSDTIDLNDNQALQVEISDALSERECVKFTVHTKTNMPEFEKPEYSVVRLHEEFLWLHDVISNNESYYGYIIPPPPPRPDFDASREKLQKLSDEEEVMTDEEFSKMKEELEAEYLATFKKTVAMHEIFLQRLAVHPIFRNDNNFRIFLQYENDLSNLLYRRARCLSNYEAANRNLDKARRINKEVQVAENSQQEACEKFESISKLAKQELIELKARKVSAFRKNFIDFVELQIKDAKDILLKPILRIRKLNLNDLYLNAFLPEDDHAKSNSTIKSSANSSNKSLIMQNTPDEILNSPGNQILSNLKPQEYENVVNLVEQAILATDLAFFFKNKYRFIDNIKDLSQAFQTSENKCMFMAMLMTLCDLNAISKPWPLQRKIAEKVTQEFFTQGDIERQIFNVKPMDMFNREKISELPRMQIDFINSICQPIFIHFYKIFDGQFPYRNYVLINKYNWLKLADQSDQLKDWAGTQLELFDEELKEIGLSTEDIEKEGSSLYNQI
ncbi:hypothetical protein RND71_043745 [Anisodus tanguticus]|uniref:Uncharacterized protein n=1 Tax=Anisodus tanguticus TaxID=243964 RepID=A0AAE1QQ54_9SOLA|nr:hypothetical protein RND71_043745 [Anisodus tanguticus]